MFCTRTTNCCVRRPPAPFVVRARASAAPPPSLVEREAVKWDLNHDVAVVVRPRRSFLAFTFLSLAGAAVHFTHPLPPRPLFSRPRDQSICLPQKKGLLSKLARVMTRAFLEYIFFSVDGRKRRRGREKGQIRGIQRGHHSDGANSAPHCHPLFEKLLILRLVDVIVTDHLNVQL